MQGHTFGACCEHPKHQEGGTVASMSRLVAFLSNMNATTVWTLSAKQDDLSDFSQIMHAGSAT